MGAGCRAQAEARLGQLHVLRSAPTPSERPEAPSTGDHSCQPDVGAASRRRTGVRRRRRFWHGHDGETDRSREGKGPTVSNNNAGAAASDGAIYGLGIFGAWVYFWQQADSMCPRCEGTRREPMNHLSGAALEIDDDVETQRREVALVEG